MWNSKYSSGLESRSVCVVSLILGHCELLKLKFIPKTTSFQPPQILLQIIVDKPQKAILTWHNQLKVLQTFDSNGQFANWFPNQPSQPKWAPIGPCHFFPSWACSSLRDNCPCAFFYQRCNSYLPAPPHNLFFSLLFKILPDAHPQFLILIQSSILVLFPSSQPSHLLTSFTLEQFTKAVLIRSDKSK